MPTNPTGVAPRPPVPFNSWSRTPPKPAKRRAAGATTAEIEAFLRRDHQRVLANAPAQLAASNRRAAARTR